MNSNTLRPVPRTIASYSSSMIPVYSQYTVSPKWLQAQKAERMMCRQNKKKKGKVPQPLPPLTPIKFAQSVVVLSSAPRCFGSPKLYHPRSLAYIQLYRVLLCVRASESLLGEQVESPIIIVLHARILSTFFHHTHALSTQLMGFTRQRRPLISRRER